MADAWKESSFENFIAHPPSNYKLQALRLLVSKELYSVARGVPPSCWIGGSPAKRALLKFTSFRGGGAPTAGAHLDDWGGTPSDWGGTCPPS